MGALLWARRPWKCRKRSPRVLRTDRAAYRVRGHHRWRGLWHRGLEDRVGHYVPSPQPMARSIAGVAYLQTPRSCGTSHCRRRREGVRAWVRSHLRGHWGRVRNTGVSASQTGLAVHRKDALLSSRRGSLQEGPLADYRRHTHDPSDHLH